MKVLLFKYMNGEYLGTREMREVNNGNRIKLTLDNGAYKIQDALMEVVWSSDVTTLHHQQQQIAAIRYVPQSGKIVPNIDMNAKFKALEASGSLLDLLRLTFLQYGENSDEFNVVSKTCNILENFLSK